ncbi:MAG: carbamoyltransferase HypF [Bacteroidota bacterium]
MITRAKINIRGAVQGVGFRPFIYRLAANLDLKGFVYNSSQGVFIEAEGDKHILEEFILKIEKEKPELSFISGMEFSFLDSIGFEEFKIIDSKCEDEKSTIILPDIAVCEDCLQEMNNSSNRRYHYPFINCTNCGPRFSIIESLPYDRPNTSMKEFIMCEECQAEYENPLDRRFHAQPTACPKCGPQVELISSEGEKVVGNSAIDLTADKVREGKIIALKGLGGYQLIVDARNDDAVKQLRERKHRDEKPFALMFPSIDSINEACDVSEFEKRVLQSPESPIVLLKRKDENSTDVAESVAPGNPYLGIMLPYTPIHHLLLNNLDLPIVATSGNISEEPICIDEKEAFEKLTGIADYFLIHNRPIVRQVDDSIVRVVLGREMVLRRARGYAPLPIHLSEDKSQKSILAVGGHLKNSIALKLNENVFVSQHIGDLSTESAYSAFIKVIDDFERLYESEPSEIICDLHPEYLSTLFAKLSEGKCKPIQHHYAHVASCRAENQVTGSALGVAWDGTGYGFDNTIWGGEFFISNENEFSHIAQFKQFPLPGGEKAIKEARRAALGALYELYGENVFNNYVLIEELTFTSNETEILRSMLNKNINSPKTSSVGRLFDAVSALLGVSSISNYEGQSAMKLEFLVDKNISGEYQFELIENEKILIDWSKMIESILSELNMGITISEISTKFHNTLSRIILDVAQLVGEEKVILSGGCFQNIYLVEKTIELLESNNRKVYIHQRVPTNDGGIALGQIAAANTKYVDFDLSTLKIHQNAYVNS